MLQGQRSAGKSQAATVESSELKEKIALLEENVESLMNQDRSLDEEIKEAKINFETVKNGLTNQIQLINVSFFEACLKFKFSQFEMPDGELKSTECAHISTVTDCN